MTTNALKTVLFADLGRELDTTRRVLERIPDDRLRWKPHEKSMSAGQLGAHLANVVWWNLVMARDPGFDMAVSPPPRDVPSVTQQILDRFDSTRVEFDAAFARLSDEDLMVPWIFRNGEHEIFRMPRYLAMRIMGLSHQAHHRGQLSVYLRLLDVPVPPIYGPSADERGGI